MNDENLKPCKPGETHNPNGRPKGSKSFSTRIKELLSGISQDKDWTSPLAAEKMKIIFSKNEDGGYRYPIDQRQKAIDTILDRIEGKPLQSIRQQTEHLTKSPMVEAIEKIVKDDTKSKTD